MGIVAKIRRILNKCKIFISFNKSKPVIMLLFYKSKLGVFLLHFLFKSRIVPLALGRPFFFSSHIFPLALIAFDFE